MSGGRSWQIGSLDGRKGQKLVKTQTITSQQATALTHNEIILQTPGCFSQISLKGMLQWKGKKRNEFSFPLLRTKKIKRTMSRAEHSYLFFFFFFTLTAPEEEKLKFSTTSGSFSLCNLVCSLQSLDHVGHVVSGKRGLLTMFRAETSLSLTFAPLLQLPRPCNPP